MQLKANILEAIGNTPLIRLNKIVKPNSADVYVKCEFLNPTGSIKDRMALHILENAEKKGLLKPGSTIVEGTSGNTGLSLAMVAAVKGYKCIVTMPDKMSQEKRDMLKAFGAEVVITPTNVPHDSPECYVEVAKKIAKETPNSFYVNQYNNKENITAHFESTAKEIWEQTEGKFDAFVVGSGTGGTISGVGRFLKQKKSNVKVIGVDPEGSVNFDYFYSKKLPETFVYKVEGIGQDYICEALDFSVIDEFRQVNDQEAFTIARRLVREEGIFCGGSSGSAVKVGLDVAKEMGPGHKVVVVLTDSATRYTTKFLSDDWMKANGFQI